MKKILLLFVAIMSFAIAANAQSDQCRITGGNGGYLKAYVSYKGFMDRVSNPKISITVTPSVDQPSDGSVIVKVVYIRNSDGERETITANLDFRKNQSRINEVELDSPAKRIVSIEIWGAECESVNRNNY